MLDVLVDAFEKNEVIDDHHWRDLPMPDEAAAIRKLGQLADEARRWKGEPRRDERVGPRRVVAWEDLEIRQIGRGVMVRVRAPWLSTWWHDRDTWAGDPIGPIHAWIAEERGAR